MFERKRTTTSREGSYSGARSGSGDGQLYIQDWAWEAFKNSRSASAWKDNKKKPLSKFNNKKLEAKMWTWKMVLGGVTTFVPERVVSERAVNAEDFPTIGITQKFEGLSWERVLDWCEDITSKVYLVAVCEWLRTLRFVNMDGPAPTWQLIGNIGKNQMVMLFEHMNAISRILQGISLENVMVRFGDRGKVKAPDCRVLHSLLYWSPRLSWRQIEMTNIWDTRESCTRNMISYVRLLSAMILQQNVLPAESLWATRRLRSKYLVICAEDEETVEEEDETEPAGPRGQKKRYMRPHRELSEDVARFVTCRRVPSYQNFNRGQQEVFDNVSVVMGEGREYEARRRNGEQEPQAQLQAH
ncbi:hypothetical protein Hanom_Chr12g01141741 [Helianthus anomalus]